MSETTSPDLDFEDLRHTIADILDVEIDELTDDAHFVETLGVDSLMALEVMVVLERKYGVKLQEDELKEVTTLKKAYGLLGEKVGKQ
ncbi:polyketide-8 synthase acyl carrier protein [Streptomyces abyssalis]|uniref:Polyketide-8 synthase acyl carrier protein n=1 Tax=Streptomyces abyssalis TaxID=933944 RepID=A0A1E7JMV1_9ACTN|nr:acyl carrier protein [Streptomyces abyssalis]OEU87006.1 polyketide-8 synthase acyl carrier protein [Streptomyces abyssalis]OEU89609.1 polyketide-8 synthase acyl carrier protein [Streptomyces abyssalis]OEV21090.1 polyketide-8 synthase acyl carrier protein [Streptomyces nanshensis]